MELASEATAVSVQPPGGDRPRTPAPGLESLPVGQVASVSAMAASGAALTPTPGWPAAPIDGLIDSDAEESDAESDAGRVGSFSALPALLPEHTLPHTWSGVFADRVTENVFQVETHCVQYPVLLLILAILILVRIGALLSTAVLPADAVARRVRRDGRCQFHLSQAARPHYSHHVSIAGSLAIWNPAGIGFPSVLYVFRILAFVGFAMLLVVATMRYVRHKLRKPCYVSQWPHAYQLFVCVVLLMHLVPSFIVGALLASQSTHSTGPPSRSRPEIPVPDGSCVLIALHCPSPTLPTSPADAYVCDIDFTSTVNCMSLQRGFFPLGFALEAIFVAVSIAFLVQHYVIGAAGIIAAFATAFAYLYALRSPPAAGSSIAQSATKDAVRIGITLGGLALLCLAVSIFSQRLSRGSFTAAWSLRAQFLEQRDSIRRERSLRNELQASRDVVLISQTARGIQELVAGFLSHRLRNPGEMHRTPAIGGIASVVVRCCIVTVVLSPAASIMVP